MFRNILVPLDFTTPNWAALKVAADLAKRDGGQVDLLHVIQTIPRLPVDDDRKFYGSLEQAARRQLDEFGSRLNLLAVRWRASVRLGSRLVEILDRVAEEQTDLIVLSSHRVVGPGGSSRGCSTLSYQVAVLASCPVLLVK